MTKKDYELIADVLANSEALSSKARKKLAGEFGHKLALDNPLFQPARFWDAANKEPKRKADK